MENKLFGKSRKLSFHWNIGSWMGLLGSLQAGLSIVEILLNLSGLDYTVFLVFQFLFLAVSLFLFIDSTFLRENSSRIFFITSINLLCLLYVVFEIVFSFRTLGLTLAYISNNPSEYSTEAAEQTAISVAHNLCTQQVILYSISLVFIIGVGILAFFKILNGEATTIYYTSFGLAIAFVFFGSYIFSNFLSALANFSSASFAMMVESRSIVAFLVVSCVTSFLSDFDPDKGKTAVRDF